MLKDNVDTADLPTTGGSLLAMLPAILFFVSMVAFLPDIAGAVALAQVAELVPALAFLPILVTMPLMGLRDKVVFLAARSEQYLPIMLFSLPAGAAADVWDRRVIMLVAQGTMLAVSVALAVLAWLVGRVRGDRFCLRAAEVELDRGPLAGPAFDLRGSARLARHAIDHRQAQARALADLLGGVERIEGPLRIGEARAVVFDLQEGAAFGLAVDPAATVAAGVIYPNDSAAEPGLRCWLDDVSLPQGQGCGDRA